MLYKRVILRMFRKTKEELLLVLRLPLAGGTLAVWVYGLEVLSILLVFYLERSPRHQGTAEPLRERDTLV